MKESKFVRTKIVVGYVLIALIGLTAMIYVWRQTGALLEPDHSQQELRRRRGLVNQTLYHLYEAETYGQMLVAGYASYENRYKRELRLVRECIDSLRMRADDESQQMRLDTIVRLIAGKEQGIKALDRNLRSAGTATLLSENIQRMIPMLDSLSQPTIEPDTILVRDTVRVAPKKKRNFFRRFGDLFSPPKNDSQVVVKTRVRIDAPPRQMSLGDTIAVVLQDLEQRVTSERLALYDKAWREGLRLQRNNQQINQRIYRLIIDFEEEETAYLWERMQAREQVRRSSLVILGSVAAGSLLVMLLFVGILWRDVNRSNRYKRQLEAANRHNEALLEAREKLMLTITHDIKAPLGSIMGYIDLLTRLDLGKRGALYLDHMKSSADHLLELVTDLLDFYKLDSNKVAVNRIAFSPADLFTAVCTGFEPVAAAKGIELRCTLAAELSGQVAGDPSRVRQIAENLLSNAIKFTDRGFVAFDAWLEEGRLLFRVSDTGRGIGPEERERIFQEFVRLPSAGGVSGGGEQRGRGGGQRGHPEEGAPAEIGRGAGHGSPLAIERRNRVPAGLPHRTMPRDARLPVALSCGRLSPVAVRPGSPRSRPLSSSADPSRPRRGCADARPWAPRRRRRIHRRSRSRPCVAGSGAGPSGRVPDRRPAGRQRQSWRTSLRDSRIRCMAQCAAVAVATGTRACTVHPCGPGPASNSPSSNAMR